MDKVIELLRAIEQELIRTHGEMLQTIDRQQARIEQIEGECRYLKQVVRGEAELESEAAAPEAEA